MGKFGAEITSSLTPQSLMPCKVEILRGGKIIAIGTGSFILDKNKAPWLVTNWHNVTGRNPTTHKIISNHGSKPVPDAFRIHCHLAQRNSRGGLMSSKEFTFELPLYRDEQCFQPLWKEHSKLKSEVDLALVPIKQPILDNLPPGFGFFELGEKYNWLQVRVGMEVFALGFPRGISGGRHPIWKRGSIASEPYQKSEVESFFYIDSATREGMSGSPVFAQFSGMSRIEGTDKYLQGGPVYRFLGVYSGRVGNDEFGAQLGIVWKETLIYEIAEKGVAGTSSELLCEK